MPALARLRLKAPAVVPGVPARVNDPPIVRAELAAPALLSLPALRVPAVIFARVALLTSMDPVAPVLPPTIIGWLLSKIDTEPVPAVTVPKRLRALD